MPSRETLWFVPLAIAGLVIGMAFTIFLSPAIGVPLLVIAGIIGAIGWFRQNRSERGQVEQFREQACESELLGRLPRWNRE